MIEDGSDIIDLLFDLFVVVGDKRQNVRDGKLSAVERNFMCELIVLLELDFHHFADKSFNVG